MIAAFRVVLASLLLQATTAWSCTCLGTQRIIESRDARDHVVTAAVSIIRARITHVRSDGAAEIEIVETFKGTPPAVLVPLRAPGSACGTSFRAGEDQVFFLYDDSLVSMCGRHPPSAELIDALRRKGK